MIEGGRRVRRAACTALAVLYACTSATWTAPATAAPNAKTDVLVFAAASTANAIGEVVALYTADGRGIARASFASSGTLARQIELGAPANVFISANKKWMDYLAGHRLIVAGSRFDLFGNRLGLIAPAARKFKLAIVPGFESRSRWRAVAGPESAFPSRSAATKVRRCAESSSMLAAASGIAETRGA